ncbi:MAG: DNA repair protein RecN [Phototrophicaceae bacterium]
MLEEIRISNFAIIDQLELHFTNGLNVISGETGAGKSIIIDAVEVLMGGKAEPSMIRAGADKAVIEAVFSVTPAARPYVLPILEQEGLIEGSDPDSIILSREIRQNGRSTARVNGSTINISILNSVGTHLIDIHGQSEHLSLLKPRSHIDLLDRYASLFDRRQQLGEMVGELSVVRKELRILQSDRNKLERRAEQLRYDIEQIESANLKAGEEDQLEIERKRLGSSEQLAKLLQDTLAILDGDDTNDSIPAIDQLQQIAVLVEKIAHIDKSLKEEVDTANSLSDTLQELALTLRDYADDLEYDPDRLDEIQERLELINTLRRRYGITVSHVLEYCQSARIELERIDNSDIHLEKLEAEEDALLHKIGAVSQTLSQARQQAGEKLAWQIVQELGDLRMGRARFSVQVSQQRDQEGCFVGDQRLAFDASGVDHVEFMMSANPGEPMMPLAKVASGGETARIMLAMKQALTMADPTDTLIFDEIDQGIGGRLGSVVGEKLWNLANHHQVLVVTHLAQLAAYSDAHFKVEKRIINNRTSTHIQQLLTDEARTAELAEMLGTTGESGEQSARDLTIAALGYKGLGTHTPPQA